MVKIVKNGIALSDTPFSDLLPRSISHSPELIAASQALDRLFISVQRGINDLSIWANIDSTEEPRLSTLALSFSLTHEYTWQLAESLTTKRNLLRNAIDLHRYKGTPWAVREIVRLLGFGEVTLIEGRSLVYNGAGTYSGAARYSYGDELAWATYSVRLNQPITNDQAVLLRRAIEDMAPKRSELISLDYTGVPIRYNAAATQNGGYNYGSVKKWQT